MTRHRPPYVAQGTWRSGALHVWGWNGVDTASMAWLYSGFRRMAADGTRTGWHDAPISYGPVARVTIPIEGRPPQHAASVQLDPFGCAVWLSELPSGDHLSDSLAWFARLAELARRTVSTGHVSPVVVEEGPFTVARWRPVVTPPIAETLDRLTAAMPPICFAGSSATTEHVFERMVDGLARSFLVQAGWRPDLGRQRKPAAQALRAVFGALAKPDHVVRSGSDDFEQALGELSAELDRHRRRVNGEPVVVPRVRLLIPDDPLEPWQVRLELVDDMDSMRWCTANDVWERNERAREVAGDRRPAGGGPHADRQGSDDNDDNDDGDGDGHSNGNDNDHSNSNGNSNSVDAGGNDGDTGAGGDGGPAEDADGTGIDRLAPLAALVSEVVDRIAPVVPGLAELATQHEPTGVELDLETAADFLDVAPVELPRAGIELIGPERLVRSRVAVAGDAAAAPADDRRARFGREAIVAWKMLVDGEEISPAELERAAEAGATLLHTGHRWVRIDPAELRRKRARLTELQETKQRVTPLELLQLANDDDARDDGAVITVHGSEAGGAGATADGVASPAAVTGSDAGVGVADWIGALLAGLPDERLVEVVESADFTGELRHYQRRGLGWMQFLARLGLGGCLADDMGLGKTATTLAHLVERPGPHLVVCPLSVVRNWRAEAARFTPALDVTVHHGANRGRIDDDELFAADPARQLVITTYGLLPRDLAHLDEREWSTLVLDEAQMVKNPNTKAARAVRTLRAGQRLALTGTPVENRLSELWAILDAVNPGILGGLESFRRRFGTPIERNGDELAAARLRRITGPFVLRRTKADRRLIPDLPDKIEQIAYARLTREQAVLYQQVVDQLLADAEQSTGMQRRGQVLAALMRLKQICNHPAQALRDGSRLEGRSGKLARFDELVAVLLDEGERALVFTQFREMGDLLARHVREQLAIDAPFLHGGVSRAGRDRMIDAFQDLTGPPLLIVSLKAGGTGLNLTAASQVIHYDRWWNPAVEDQATDRAWRIGQQRTVNVHKLVCEGTVEERIGTVIDEKRKLADAVVGNSEAWLSELSTDQLRELVVLEDDR